MADAIEQLRTATERDLAALIGKLGPSHRRRVMDAIEVYGSARAIPEEVWESIRRDIDEESSAALLLLLVGVYGAEYRRARRQLPADKRSAVVAVDDEALRRAAAGPAATVARQVADDYVSGIQRRMASRIDDNAAELNQLPPRERARAVRQTIDDIVGEDTAAAAVVDSTARGINAAGEAAAGDIGRQTGARIVAVWVIEDAKACPVCKALNGKTSDEWALILEGIGESDAITFVMSYGGAHPHCRCRRKYVVMDRGDN